MYLTRHREIQPHQHHFRQVHTVVEVTERFRPRPIRVIQPHYKES